MDNPAVKNLESRISEIEKKMSEIENLIIYSAERVRRHPLICTEKGLPRRQPFSIGKFPT